MKAIKKKCTCAELKRKAEEYEHQALDFPKGSYGYEKLMAKSKQTKLEAKWAKEDARKKK